jgi:hypothetical protein
LILKDLDRGGFVQGFADSVENKGVSRGGMGREAEKPRNDLISIGLDRGAVADRVSLFLPPA